MIHVTICERKIEETDLGSAAIITFDGIRIDRIRLHEVAGVPTVTIPQRVTDNLRQAIESAILQKIDPEHTLAPKAIPEEEFGEGIVEQ